MGWTFCPPQPGVQHKKETVCCDFCGRCPRCSPTPMEAVSDGYGPVYYVCKDHHFRPKVKDPSRAFVVDVGTYSTVEALHRAIDRKLAPRPVEGGVYRIVAPHAPDWDGMRAKVVKVKRTRAICETVRGLADVPFTMLAALTN